MVKRACRTLKKAASFSSGLGLATTDFFVVARTAWATKHDTKDKADNAQTYKNHTVNALSAASSRSGSSDPDKSPSAEKGKTKATLLTQ